MNIEKYGWNSRWLGAYRSLAGETETPARVTSVYRGWLEVEAEHGPVRVPQAARGNAHAAVGDWVTLDEHSARVARILPRQSQISRKAPGGVVDEQVLAANADVALLVMGLDGDFNIRRTERYLVVMRESGVRPAIALNKADLASDASAQRTQVERIARNCPVIVLSAIHEDVASILDPIVDAGESLALLGSSGAGKSTMLNAILGEERQRTMAVREHDSRGRHTTTSRQLLLAPQGWLIFDLPGLRELQLWAGTESLNEAFDEIAELATHCRFRDCRHQGEPGCAVSRLADAERLASYHRLRREIESLEERHAGPASANTKRRWKSIHKAMRDHPKYNRE